MNIPPQSHQGQPSRGLTLLVLIISLTATIAAGGFAWTDLTDIMQALTDGHVLVTIDWVSLAIPGVVTVTTTLTLLTAIHLLNGTLSLSVRQAGNLLFVAGIGLALLGWLGGRLWLEELLEDRGYHACADEDPMRLFSDTEVWAVHAEFCSAGPEVEKLTIDQMRDELLQQQKTQNPGRTQ